jgi:hypothetical protein
MQLGQIGEICSKMAFVCEFWSNSAKPRAKGRPLGFRTFAVFLTPKKDLSEAMKQKHLLSSQQHPNVTEELRMMMMYEM